MDSLEYLVLKDAPPLDPEWLQYEEEAKLKAPKKVHASPLDRQPEYAQECRDLHASLLAPGSVYHDLSKNIITEDMGVSSSLDDFSIPILKFASTEPAGSMAQKITVVYYHGGGLYVGEADSEEISCRLIVRRVPNVTLYSVGYRLMPAYPASTCVADAIDAFKAIRMWNPEDKIVVVGSSSGGQLAAFVQQMAPLGSIAGVLLRSPVTSDVCSGPEFVPEKLRHAHTSASESFVTSLLGIFSRAVPRDGLDRMPLEANEDQLKGLPRTWIQICTNDTLYSDGLCYAMALKDAGVDVKVDVVRGWPHTFWLKTPHLPRAMEAERAMVDGLNWLIGGE